MATLFTKIERGREVRMIQAIIPGVGRKTIRLGPTPPRAAERVREKVESLVAAKRLNQPIDPELAGWLKGLADDFYKSLASVHLVEPRSKPTDAPTLDVFATKYITQKTGQVKPRSIQLLEQTKSRLVAHFGAGTPLDRITPDGAADWRAAMVKDKLSEATSRLHTRNAKSIFNHAVERELLVRNPFRSLPSSAVAAERDHYVTLQDAEKCLKHLPDHDWKLLFGLARFAGLRVPSETHALEWANVDIQRNQMSVYASKTNSTRTVPIIPRLRALLEVARSQRNPDRGAVLSVSANNLHRGLEIAIKAAGLKRWPDLFQALRRSCETDLANDFPQHAVSKWLGHGIGVSAKFYLQIPQEFYERAGSLIDRSALHQALQQRPAQKRTKAQTPKPLKLVNSDAAA